MREASARAQAAEAAADRAREQLEAAQQKLAAATSASQVSGAFDYLMFYSRSLLHSAWSPPVHPAGRDRAVAEQGRGGIGGHS